MKVLIGTKNPSKIQGAQKAFAMTLTQFINKDVWSD